jgi:hypothetical protein
LKRLFIISILLAFFSCEDVINIDIDKNSDHVVVEGWVTDQPGPQVVLLSRSNRFNSNQPNPSIDDAQVFIHSNRGDSYSLTLHAPGIYHSDSSFQGQVGIRYFVQVILATSDTISSDPELLMAVHPIDSIGFDSYEGSTEENPDEIVNIYYPIAFAVDPRDEVNYYRWNLYRNNTLFSTPDELYLSSDRFINGNSYRNEFTSFEYLINDNIYIEVQSLSQAAFEYLELFKSQTTSLQTGSGSSPSAIHSNLFYLNNSREIVLGYFGATSVQSRSKSITE